MKIIATALLSLIAACLALALTGCALNINADGCKSATLDGPSTIKFAKVLIEK